MRRTIWTIAAVAAVGWAAASLVLLVEIRNDADAAADAILLRDGAIANGVWVAVHSEQRPIRQDGKIRHTAPAAPGEPVAAPAAPDTAVVATPTTRPTTTTTRRPQTTTTTVRLQKMVIEDFYLAADRETYFVEVSGVSGATYCEAHMVGSDGRRTGEWTNELLDGRQDTVTLQSWKYSRPVRPQSVEVECS